MHKLSNKCYLPDHLTSLFFLFGHTQVNMSHIQHHLSREANNSSQSLGQRVNGCECKINRHVIAIAIILVALKNKVNVLTVSHGINRVEHINECSNLSPKYNDCAMIRIYVSPVLDHHICHCCLHNWNIFHRLILMGKWSNIIDLTNGFNDTSS